MIFTPLIRPGAGRFACLLLGICVLATDPAAAQVNIEDLRPDDPPDGVSGSLGGDLTIQTGNVDFIRIGLQARLNEVDGDVHTLIIGDGGLGFLGSSRFSSSGLAHYRRTYWVSPRLAPEWFGQMNYDRSRALAFRALVGGGARSASYGEGWGRVGGGASLMLEHERFIVPDTIDASNRQTAVRSSTFLTLSATFADDAGASSTTYVQPRIWDPGDLRILHDLTVSTGLTEQWHLTVSFDLRYDSRPLPHVASLDTRLRTGVTLRH